MAGESAQRASIYCRSRIEERKRASHSPAFEAFGLLVGGSRRLVPCHPTTSSAVIHLRQSGAEDRGAVVSSQVAVWLQEMERRKDCAHMSMVLAAAFRMSPGPRRFGDAHRVTGVRIYAAESEGH